MLAQLQYANDARNTMMGSQGVFYPGLTSPTAWSIALRDLGYLKINSLLFCPSQPRTDTSNQKWKFTYGLYEVHTTSWNGNTVTYYKDRIEETGSFALFTGTTGGKWALYYVTSRMKKPGQLALVSDTIYGADNATQTKGYGAWRFYPAQDYPFMYLFSAHDGKTVQGFADGHVASRNRSELKKNGFWVKTIADFQMIAE